jgi:predicted amidohydrolase YtcJ
MADGTHTLFVNGTILTVDPQNSMAEAMVIADGTILAVGTEAAVRAAASPEATVIDLQGKTLMPGLIDAHMHPMGGGAQLTACSLNHAPLTVDQALAEITLCLAAMADEPADPWLQAQGRYRQAMQPAGVDLSAVILDRLAMDRPMIAFGSDFHSLAANTAAITAAGITNETPDPEGGVIMRHAGGKIEVADLLFPEVALQRRECRRLAASGWFPYGAHIGYK